VFYCHLGVGVGSEFQKRRPCVVLSNSINNINSSVIVVAPITHTNKNYPIFVPLNDKLDASGSVTLAGYVDLSNIRSISSYRLAGLICELDGNEMKQIDATIARHLDLMHHYNTQVKIVEDKNKHADALNTVLELLRDITDTETNQELVKFIKELVATQANNDARHE
jgi:mRNA interferase MazF